MQEKRIHAIISGRVQGVFYRASTAEEAKKIGLTGWVRNLTDGRVELVAEGSKDQINSLLIWCRNGPPLAVVDTVNAEEEAPTNEFNNFFIRY